MLVERLLAFGTRERDRREGSELHANAARVVASIAKEVAEVAIILAVKVDLLDFGMETLRSREPNQNQDTCLPLYNRT